MFGWEGTGGCWVSIMKVRVKKEVERRVVVVMLSLC